MKKISILLFLLLPFAFLLLVTPDKIFAVSCDTGQKLCADSDGTEWCCANNQLCGTAGSCQTVNNTCPTGQKGCYGSALTRPDWCCPQNLECGPKDSGACYKSQFGAIGGNPNVFKYNASVIGMRQLFSNVIAFFTIAGGLVVLFLLVTGGIAYMTSGGDPKAMGSAQSRITHALIGLAILVLATVIMSIISRVLGVDFLKLPWPSAPQ